MAKRKRQVPRTVQGADHTVAQNRRARYDYEILSYTEAGLVLLGSEIKSIRSGTRISPRATRASATASCGWRTSTSPPTLPPARITSRPDRGSCCCTRRRIRRLERSLGENPRTTLVPVRLYLKAGRAKVELAVGRGRRAYDKRQAIARRDAARSIQRALRHSVRESPR